MTDFIKDCLRTKSDKFYGDKVSKEYLDDILKDLILTLQALDNIKKALFYGRQLGLPTLQGIELDNCKWLDTKLHPDIIHCIIGKATEAGELLELLYGVLFEDKEFDPVNFKEEIFDGNWYDGIGLNAVDATFEEIWETGIAKLKQRFPEKFTEHAANNRNLKEERKILEGKQNDT